MSQTSLEFSISGDTPVTVVLTDAGATYGVKRTDTNAVVVAAGTPMVAGGGGIWTYTFTDPLAGLTYAYSMQYAFADGTVGYVTGTKISAQHSVTPTDIEKVFGTTNVQTWADKDATGDATIIATAIDYAQTLAGRRTALRASELRAPIPGPSSPLYPGIQDYETVFAGVFLWQGRGQIGSNQGSEGGGPYNAMMAHAEEQLTGVLIASRDQSGIQGVNVSAPQAIGSGSNVAAVDRLPVQPFAWGGWWGYPRY